MKEIFCTASTLAIQGNIPGPKNNTLDIRREGMKKLISIGMTIIGVFMIIAIASGCSSTPAAAQKPAETAKPESTASGDQPKAEAKSAEGSSQGQALPAGEVILLDNFEEGMFWNAVGDSWDQWGSHNYSLEAELTETWKSEGTYGMECVFEPFPDGKMATWFCDQLLEPDWTGVKYFVIDVNNPGKEPFTLVFSCQTTDNWTWSQTKGYEVPPGVSTVVFDLTKDIFDGSGQKIKEIPGLHQVKRAMFNIVKFKDIKSFYVDNVRVIK